jgi:hypothetical protein
LSVRRSNNRTTVIKRGVGCEHTTVHKENDMGESSPRRFPGRLLSAANSLGIASATRAYGAGKDMEACIGARPNMITTLNSFRDTLEDLGGGLGVTDPVAGFRRLSAEVVRGDPDNQKREK